MPSWPPRNPHEPTSTAPEADGFTPRPALVGEVGTFTTTDPTTGEQLVGRGLVVDVDEDGMHVAPLATVLVPVEQFTTAG